ncbi:MULTISPECIES: class I SAM-dependent methyltransferase [unclassified Nostoc]|uniref:class I SAM-dependent methyltransferase n=1 Tax=unclassified Nostoc TaxID=2593658 RepID=UPI000DEC4845|nr:MULTISPECIES: class I SAM-dependent methyltransferase [unclassified Nostoc]MBE8988442.1 class I SAM-dependent methyltransferase [Nostoc sp. LEGE 12450]QHG18329.1 methyltransferase domain-containing protein [Nostoc sp. ATCC 53789]
MKKLYNAYSKSSIKLSKFLSYYFKGKIHDGYCPICESQVFFIIKEDWLRDFYYCLQCNSIPRQRAIIVALNLFYPEWRKLKIHESSPSGISSDFIQTNCPEYVATHFFQDTPLGDYKHGIRCENLENMTLADSSFDLIITQDVFEHVINPSAAFTEISRVLKPGGAHIFTMPWYPQMKKSLQRARLVNNEIEHLVEPIYHGNPIDKKGSLVTFDWGIDFTDYIYTHSGMSTTIYLIKDKKMGLEADFLEVFVSRKLIDKVLSKTL